MRRAWTLIALIAVGCFTEPGTVPDGWDAGDEDAHSSDAADLANPGDVGKDATIGGFAVTAEGPARLLRESSVEVPVSIARDGFDGALALEATGLPSGVVANSDGIGEGETEGVLTLSATSGARIGGPVAAGIVASAGEQEARNELLVVVAGEPGAPDSSFGVSGRVEAPAADGDDTVAAIALGDDRVRVAGRSAGATTTGYVVALENNGGVDGMFGDLGVFTELPGMNTDILGGVYDAGFVLNTRLDGTPTLLRVSPDGAPDDAWGTAQLAAGTRGPVSANSRVALWAGSTIYVFDDATTPAEFSAPVEIAALAVDGQGRFLVGHSGSLTVSRLTPAGGADANFASSGSLAIPGTYAITAIASSSDGGFVGAVENSESIVARFSDTGLVAAFGGDGVVIIGAEVNGLLAVDDGVFVLAERAGGQVVLRLGPNGAADQTFGSGGEVALADATGPARIVHDAAAGRVLVAYPIGTEIEVRRWWL